MKKNYLLYTLLLTISLSSCYNEDNWNTYSFLFFPRAVETAWSDNICRIPVVEDKDGNMTYSIDEYFEGTSCKADLYLLGLYTCNLAYDTTQAKRFTHYTPLRFLQTYGISDRFVNESNAFIERQLEDDYTRHMNEVFPEPNEWALPPIHQEYRLTEIVNLTITCDQPLFGKAAGSSLNDHFQIYKLEPFCVFAGNGQLKVTHKATVEKRNKGFAIDDYLSYRPLAAAYYYFRLTDLPSELPVSDVTFSISIETADGEVINCTGVKITLTR